MEVKKMGFESDARAAKTNTELKEVVIEIASLVELWEMDLFDLGEKINTLNDKITLLENKNV